MASYFDIIAKHLFDNDLEDVQTVSKSLSYRSNNHLEDTLIESLNNRGISVKNYSLLFGLAAWEYNTFVNRHLYCIADVWDKYRENQESFIGIFCSENKIPREVFQAIESVFHWKSTRIYAKNYSAKVSFICDLESINVNLYNRKTQKEKNANGLHDSPGDETKIEFENYWDVCVPFDTNLLSFGLILRDVVDINNPYIDKDLLQRIDQVDMRFDYVDVVENNLRRNLTEVFFYFKQNDERTAKLIFEALESFVFDTFNIKPDCIIIPLIAIHELYCKKNGYLEPMRFIKHVFAEKLEIVLEDLFVTSNSYSSNVRGSYFPLIKQWYEWRGLVVPPNDLCNMIYALVLMLQADKEVDSIYYLNKIHNSQCKTFAEDVSKLKTICSSIDVEIIDTFLDERNCDVGFRGYISNDGLIGISGPPRNIKTIIEELEIPTSLGASQTDETENVFPEEGQTVLAHRYSHDNSFDNLKRAETWPLPLDFFETDYIDNTSNEGDYIPGFLSGIVDFSLIGTDVTGKAMINGVWLSKYFSNFIEELATKGCFKNDVETKLAFAHALTGRRIKQGIKWKGSTFRRWANVICYITWKLYGGKYKYISKAFPELSETKLGKSYAKNLKNYTEIKDTIDVFLNKVVFLYSNKQENDAQESEQPSSLE